jgi:[glutamine synthetase] adenylyltransferase / [glutamine synthetase]-adenylyl-L-tyrosine phosphorylase
MTATLAQSLMQPFPRAVDAQAVALFWSELAPEQAQALKPFATFIDGIVSGSPYLALALRQHADFVVTSFSAKPHEVLKQILLETIAAQNLTIDELGIKLRHLKAQFAVFAALCDLGNVWSLDNVTSAMTRFADAAIASVVNALLLDVHNAGKYNLPDPHNPAKGCCYVALAMGKHGAMELNYSSDVDLIILYDADTSCLPPEGEAAKLFVRITQRLVAVLQEITADGYVFRTDLRLRPDPRATQVAISIQSAEQYYLHQGQNWERAAFIKARPIAGDIALGDNFLADLRPYIWRKYLDFAAIADVQSLIRQIHAVKGHGEIAVEGHNLKLGRGGIREIEFFVQTQQLIAGGRNAALRGRRTVDMLMALAEAQWISVETAKDLQVAYTMLRQWEHRCQMQHDEQTHSLPTTAGFAAFAAFCGDDEGHFRTKVRDTLECVRDHSSKLFEQSSTLGGDLGALVFTGGEDDPETIETLERMGFAHASEMSATIRAWHFGRYAATRDKRAKEALTELMPKLLDALSRSGNADRSFIDFDAFLKGLPAGVQLFAMLKTNPGLLDLIAQILSTAPRLAHGLSQQPRILEAVLDPGFFGPLPSRDVLARAAQSLLSEDIPLDEAMDRMRVLCREQKFRVGVRVLSETVSAEEAGQGYTNIADCVLNTMLAAVQADIGLQHGQLQTGRVAVIAMGKLGGREMTAGSDLDLIVVYDHAESDQLSDGKRPLSASQYFTKLTQRLISAVSAPTSEGELYEVDMRLRPSGSKGPVAVSLSSFKSYQAESAWTWEKLALTRARPIAGDATLCQELETIKGNVLAEKRDEAATRQDVVSMRGLMLREHKANNPWDIKRVRGGLVEAEFIAQFLQLIYAHQKPEILDTNTLVAFRKLQVAGALPAADAATLQNAARLYHRLTQILRLCVEEDYDPANAPAGLNRAVALAAECPDMRSAEAALRHMQMAVADIFDRLVGDPTKI